jgi:hypothetical protein
MYSRTAAARALSKADTRLTTARTVFYTVSTLDSGVASATGVVSTLSDTLVGGGATLLAFAFFFATFLTTFLATGAALAFVFLLAFFATLFALLGDFFAGPAFFFAFTNARFAFAAGRFFALLFALLFALPFFFAMIALLLAVLPLLDKRVALKKSAVIYA